MAETAGTTGTTGTGPEDSVDAKLRDLKKILQKLSCTYVSKKNEDFETYHKKEPDVRPKKEPEVPNIPKVIPEEGTSVDPPTPGDELDCPLPTKDKTPAETPPLPIVVPEGGDAVKVVTDEMKGLNLDDSFQYNMHHNARGLFVLFNVASFKGTMDKREGTGADAQLLEKTFNDMGFEVIRIDNAKAAHMVAILETVASYDHSNMDCVAVGILTHGTWEIYRRESDNNPAIADTILASDRSMMFEDLTAPFRAKNCHKTLKGKPKLFFIQACRGEKLAERAEYPDTMKLQFLPKDDSNKQGSTTADSVAAKSEGEGTRQTPEEVAEDEGDNRETWVDRQGHSLPENMPIYKDFLVAWSTAPGYFSFRNEDKGSIFIQTLCRYLTEFHATSDLLSILTWCNSDIAHTYQSFAPSTVNNHAKRDLHHKKQMPWYFSRLTKEIVFVPKPRANPIP